MNIDDLMAELIETRSFDEVRDWRKMPELGEEDDETDDLDLATLGGPGSGFHGHAGRPGEIGGSAPGSGAGAASGHDEPFTVPAARLAEVSHRNYDEIDELGKELYSGVYKSDTGYRREVSRYLQKLIDNSQQYIRTDANSLELILESGRFKSQHETRTSEGYLDPAFRTKVEAKMFGEGIPCPTECPIYGYLATDDAEAVLSWSSVKSYGDVVVALKPRQDTTVNFGDSFGSFAGDRSTPMPITGVDSRIYGPDVYSAKEEASSTEALKTLDPLRWSKLESAERATDYVEAQFHRGVTVADIRMVILPSIFAGDERWEGFQLLQRKLTEMGVPWKSARDAVQWEDKNLFDLKLGAASKMIVVGTRGPGIWLIKDGEMGWVLDEARGLFGPLPFQSILARGYWEDATMSAAMLDNKLAAVAQDRTLGGPGSGNFGHAGRPGEVGGSGPESFHGTTTQTIANIKTQGLLASKNTDIRGGRAPSVFVTTDEDRAHYYGNYQGAEKQASGYYAGDYAIVKIDVPREYWDKHAIEDEKDQEEGSFRFEQDIPVEWIKSIQTIGEGGALKKIEHFDAQTKNWKTTYESKNLSAKDVVTVYATVRLNADESRTLGGPGSGNFDHAGRPGEVGGSAAAGGATATDDATPAEVFALNDYVGNVDPPDNLYISGGVNRVLRGFHHLGETPPPTAAQERYYRQQAASLQSLIDRSPTTTDRTLYRGVNANLDAILRKRDGQEFMDNGFTSLGSDAAIVKERFTGIGAYTGQVYEVRVPKGTSLLDVDAILRLRHTGEGEYVTESEHILGQGTRFRVNGRVLTVLR